MFYEDIHPSYFVLKSGDILPTSNQYMMLKGQTKKHYHITWSPKHDPRHQKNHPKSFYFFLHLTEYFIICVIP